MTGKKFRWSKVYESQEEELVAFLDERGIKTDQITTEEPNDIQSLITASSSTIWCAEGSLSVRTANTRTVLQPGDALRLEAQTSYELHAGLTGYVCYVSK